MDSSPAPASEQRRRHWLAPPPEVTASIMSRVEVVDILTSVQFVCKAWLEITKDPLVWRKIDMSNEVHRYRDTELDEMCRRAVDRSCGQLADLNIGFFVTDDLLKYITDRPNKIKRFRLACCDGVSDTGLIRALQKLPLLEDIDFTLYAFSEEPVIRAIGDFCRNLKSFRLNCKFDHVTRFWGGNVTNMNMPELRHLQLIGNRITNEGLEVILDSCSKLESLDIRECRNVRMEGDVWKRCTQQIKHLRLPDEPTFTAFDYSSTEEDFSSDSETESE